MSPQRILGKLADTEWHDTHDATEGPFRVRATAESEWRDGDSYTSVKLSRRNHSDRGMVGETFLDYVANGRFEPVNEAAEAVQELVNTSNDYPTVDNSPAR